MRRVDWTEAAVRDLGNIKTYLLQFDPEMAEQAAIATLVLATDRLAEHPHAGTPLGIAGLRKWRPRRSRHVLIYRPANASIDVVRVRHEREQWRPGFD